VNRFFIGGRVIKTTLAVTLAIFFAQQLGLDRVTLAALVALITVQRTFYHSLVQSLATLGSILLGGALGTAFGYLMGLTPLSYGLVTLVSILICLRLGWHNQIILTTVTAITIIFSGDASLGMYSLIHILTAILGGVCALLLNYLFTPNHRQELIRRLQQIDADLRLLIDFIIKEIQELGCSDKDFEEKVSCLKKDIEEGLYLANLLRDEQRGILTRRIPSDNYRRSFSIFYSQLDRIEEMHGLARRIPVEVPQVVPMVKLLRLVQKIQHNKIRGRKTSYAIIEKTMQNLDKRFTAIEMPCNREEFISRSSIFHMFEEIKRYYKRTLKIPVIAE